MSCTNCFNGCTEITSDKCVKYTGADIPALGIQNGDTLQFVEQTLAQFLITTLDGTGIKPIVDLQGVCSIVANNIPVCVGCSGPTLNDLLQALIDSACDLQDLINGVAGNIENLEGPYNEGCLTVVDTTFSNTHNVLQAVIDQLCQTDELLGTTILSLNNYVLESQLTNSVVTILEEQGLVGPVTKEYTKMVPYVAYPWFAPISVTSDNFDSNGAGLSTGPYQYVYFCNGNFPGVPDLRGRVLAGVTNGMSGGAFDPAVDPNLPGNPTYGANPFSKNGANFVTLGIDQMPKHSHATTVSIDDPKHSHGIIVGGNNTAGGSQPTGSGPGSTLQTSSEFTGLKGTGPGQNVFVSNSLEGNNLSHNNTQPTIGCYYIMYIPV
jgi:microcystin-dependent protein